MTYKAEIQGPSTSNDLSALIINSFPFGYLPPKIKQRFFRPRAGIIAKADEIQGQKGLDRWRHR